MVGSICGSIINLDQVAALRIHYSCLLQQCSGFARRSLFASLDCICVSETKIQWAKRKWCRWCTVYNRCKPWLVWCKVGLAVLEGCRCKWGYLGFLWRGGNQNILNTAIHCVSLTRRIRVLSDGTNCILVFSLPCQHHPTLVGWKSSLLSSKDTLNDDIKTMDYDIGMNQQGVTHTSFSTSWSGKQYVSLWAQPSNDPHTHVQISRAAKCRSWSGKHHQSLSCPQALSVSCLCKCRAIVRWRLSSPLERERSRRNCSVVTVSPHSHSFAPDDHPPVTPASTPCQPTAGMKKYSITSSSLLVVVPLAIKWIQFSKLFSNCFSHSIFTVRPHQSSPQIPVNNCDNLLSTHCWPMKKFSV